MENKEGKMVFVMSMSIAKDGSCYIGDRKVVGENVGHGDDEIWVSRNSDELKRLKLYSTRMVARGNIIFRRFYLHGTRVQYRLRGSTEDTFQEGKYGDKMDIRIGSKEERKMFESFRSARASKRQAWEDAFAGDFNVH